jgi:hypothetical protein
MKIPVDRIIILALFLVLITAAFFFNRKMFLKLALKDIRESPDLRHKAVYVAYDGSRFGSQKFNDSHFDRLGLVLGLQ